MLHSCGGCKTAKNKNLLHCLLDSGASEMVFRDRSIAGDAKLNPNLCMNVAVDAGFRPAIYEGSVSAVLPKKNFQLPGFDRVLFPDKAVANLVSVGRLCDNGLVVVFERNRACLYREKDFRPTGTLVHEEKRSENGMYPLHLQVNTGRQPFSDLNVAEFASGHLAVVARAVIAAHAIDDACGFMTEQFPVTALESEVPAMVARSYVRQGMLDIERWHSKLGHVGLKKVRLAGIKGLVIPRKFMCDSCLHGKFHKHGHPSVRMGVQEFLPGECIHTDHRGPYSRSISGGRYAQLFLDIGSRYRWTAIMPKKSGAKDAILKVLADSKARSGRPVRYLRSDNDGTFRAQWLKDLAVERSFIHEHSAPDDHNTNPFIERDQRTILEGTATAMYHAGAPASFWAECEKHLIFTLNNIPSQLHVIAEQELWVSSRDKLEGTVRPFNLMYLQAFGTACVCYIPYARRETGKGPAQRKAFKGAIVGYTENMPAYRVWDFDALVIRDVSYSFTVCQEGYFPFRDRANWPPGALSDPVTFYPTLETFLDQEQWKAFGYDSEEAKEVLQDRAPSRSLALDKSIYQPARPDEVKIIAKPAPTPKIRKNLIDLTESDTSPLGRSTHDSIPVEVRLPTLVRSGGGGMAGPFPVRNMVPSTPVPLPTSGSNLQNFIRSQMPEPPPAVNFPVKNQLASSPSPTPVPAPTIAPVSRYNLRSQAHLATLPPKPVDIPPPATLGQAKKSPWWPAYDAAIRVELKNLEDNDTWMYVPYSEVPQGQSILRTKFVFDDKRKADGTLEKYKARLVAMGFAQKEGVDYNETFASVMTTRSFRTLLVIWNLDPSFVMEHWDVKAAFINAPLAENVFVHQPTGFEKPGYERCVLKLKKALYGTKQAAFAWQTFLRAILLGLGGVKNLKDECVYCFRQGNGWLYLSTHVDDLFPLFNPSGKQIRDRIFAELTKRMTVDNRGVVSWALDTRIDRDPVKGVVKISQCNYTKALIADCQMQKCRKQKESTLQLFLVLP